MFDIVNRPPAAVWAQRPPTFDKNPDKRPFPQRIRNEWEIIRERPRGQGKQYEVSENGRKLGWFPGTLLKGSEMLLQWEEAQVFAPGGQTLNPSRKLRRSSRRAKCIEYNAKYGWDAEVFLLRLVPYDWPDALAQSILRGAASYFVHVDMFLEWRLLHDLERPDFGIEDGGAGTDKKSQNLVVPVPLLTKLEASKAAYWMDLIIHASDIQRMGAHATRDCRACVLEAFGHIVAVPVTLPVLPWLGVLRCEVGRPSRVLLWRRGCEA
ncbi:hypothetical protein B0H14DRAFT_2618481 [Mycena olivaceomarginata]|nr:hypothetical protein B0H14DRAFT_2618481 [Mycena olivaceomarginata]